MSYIYIRISSVKEIKLNTQKTTVFSEYCTEIKYSILIIFCIIYTICRKLSRSIHQTIRILLAQNWSQSNLYKTMKIMSCWPTSYVSYRPGLNEVTLLWAWLVLGWLTHLWAGKPPRFVTSHSGQLSLLLSVGWKYRPKCGDALLLLIETNVLPLSCLQMATHHATKYGHKLHHNSLQDPHMVLAKVSTQYETTWSQGRRPCRLPGQAGHQPLPWPSSATCVSSLWLSWTWPLPPSQRE